jgi:hypothetical protein
MARVDVMKTPDGGIQPQAVIDTKDVVHLVYFTGAPGQGDLYYTHTGMGNLEFSKPIRVNSEEGSAVAVGTIRGAHIALGKGRRIHIAWNGSGSGRTKNPNGGTPMIYARLNDTGSAFEPERNLMTRTSVLDGGGSVAADGEGRVFVAWHGRAQDASEGEKGRQLFVTRSDDDGRTFAAEQPALDRATGACGCCGLRAFVDKRGNIFALYRAATENIERDMTLVVSTDHGAHFTSKSLHPWRINICPMSSEAFAEGAGAVFAAWETNEQVYFSKIDPETLGSSSPVSPPGKSMGRKHPAQAVNDRGEMIIVWTEGTGWQRGGALLWQIYDANGTPTSEKGRVSQGIPVWGLPTAVARRDGTFLILH